MLQDKYEQFKHVDEPDCRSEGEPTQSPEQDLGGCDPVDFVTVLTTTDCKLLTKTIYLREDGQLDRKAYDNARLYRIDTNPVRNLAELAQVLDGLGPQSCIVNGRIRDGIDPNDAQRTHVEKPGQIPTLEEAPHWWVPADIDGLEAKDTDGEFDPVAEPERAVAHVLSRMPSEFQDADCWWQLTSSAGFKPGINMRLVFWLSRPLTSAEAKLWLAPYLKEHASKKEKTDTERRILDGAIYTPSQPIYAAKPVLEGGIDDPVQRRSGIQTFLGCPVFVPLVLASDDSKPKTKPAEGPESVIYDDPETIAWAMETIQRDVAEKGEPKDGEGSDPRFYNLAGVLRDGPRWGRSVSDEMIAALCKAHWQPEFDLSWFQEKLRKVKYQNGPGVGPPGPGRKYGDPSMWAEYDKNAPPPPADDDTAQGSTQEPPVVSYNSPLHTAAAFIEHRFTTAQGKRTLIRYRGDWYAWTGTHYRPVSSEALKGRMYHFLNSAKVRTKGDDGEWITKPFTPDQRQVNKVLDCPSSEFLRQRAC
jgi:hypothetical protein